MLIFWNILFRLVRFYFFNKKISDSITKILDIEKSEMDNFDFYREIIGIVMKTWRVKLENQIKRTRKVEFKIEETKNKFEDYIKKSIYKYNLRIYNSENVSTV